MPRFASRRLSFLIDGEAMIRELMRETFTRRHPSRFQPAQCQYTHNENKHGT
jgi:hypothetical protein